MIMPQCLALGTGGGGTLRGPLDEDTTVSASRYAGLKPCMNNVFPGS